ncbi:S8 family serine peptidase [Calidithermus timidus]|jgi:hypothetical protein|uniref:S8 family serine peptidase n=1 Tax=Calidithermus timidus TaxID=307124 RepID=UPI00037E8CE1|nr:S8 family serine peptidase [Calidithermus timidus]
MRQILLIVLLSLLSACGLQTRPSAQDGSSPAFTIPQERQLVVGYRDSANLEAIARQVGARVVATIPQLKAALLELPEGLSQAQAARRLVAQVRYAEANRFDRQPIPLPAPRPTTQGLSSQAAFNDPLLPQQWWLGKIGAPGAWSQGAVGTNVTIGVVDSDFDRSHPDLCDQPSRSRCVGGYNAFTLSPYAPTDPFQGNPGRDTHGSGSAGMAAALSNNGQFVAGVAGGNGDPASAARLMPITIFGGSSGGYAGDLNVAQAIVWAVNGPDGLPPTNPGDSGDGADILNNSWGGGGYSYLLKDAFDYALLNRVVVVASAGNDYRDAYHLPSGLPGVIAVAATNPHDEKTDFSTYGPWVDISAPGDDVLTTYVNLGSKTWLFGGTSAAGPVVTGAAAVVLQVLRENGLSPTPYQVMRILQMTADPVAGPPAVTAGMGAGRVNVDKAVQLAKGITTPAALPADGSNITVGVLNKAADISTDMLGFVPVSSVTLVHAATGKQYHAQTGVTPDALFLGSEPGNYRVLAGGPSQLLWGGSEDPQETVVAAPAGSSPLVILYQQADLYETAGGSGPARNETPGTATDLAAFFGALPPSFTLSAAFDSNNFAQLGLPEGGPDVDVYAISLAEGETLNLRAASTYIGGQGKVKLSLIAPDQSTVVASDTEVAVPASLSFTVGAGQAGTYYVKLEEASGNQGLGYFYRLGVGLNGNPAPSF